MVVVGLFTSAPRPQSPVSLMVYDFDLGPVPASNVDFVESLGFDGIVTRCARLNELPRLAAYADYVIANADFDVFAFVNYDFNHPESPQVWRNALPILKSLDSPLWVIVKNAPTMADVDALLLTMAQESALLGVPMVIYPHWETNIETAADAAVRIAQVGHPNIRNSLHTCHEIRGGNQNSLHSVVAAHAADTSLVTIAGSDINAYFGPAPPGGQSWADAIKPLDRGSFNLLPFLGALKNVGYDGPVVLQTWAITGDPGHRGRSLQLYERYVRSL